MEALLAAASLLLGVVSVLFGLWYQEIMRAINITIPDHQLDYKGPYNKVNDILYSRAIPLTVISLMLTLVFLFDFISILWQTYQNFRDKGFGAFFDYDAVFASLVLVEILFITLFIYLCSFTRQLLAKKRKLTPQR